MCLFTLKIIQLILEIVLKMNIQEYIKELKKQTEDIFDISVQEQDHLTNAYELITNLGFWSKALNEKYSCLMLRNAVEEIEISLLQINQGLYRGSFVSLRLALEMLTGFVYFSSHNIEYKEWLNGDKDLKWSEISCKDNGVFSIRFFNAYFKECLSEQDFSFGLLKTFYRELSEMVHGNFTTWNENKAELKYDSAKIKIFNNYINNFKKISSMLLCVRFLKEIEMQNIEDLIFDDISTVEEIRKYIGGPI